MEQNMADEFKPYCINLIDKSMMEWYRKFDPGFIFVGEIPHNFGNERHQIFCGITYILWRALIVKGNDRPAQLGPKLNLEIGRTV